MSRRLCRLAASISSASLRALVAPARRGRMAQRPRQEASGDRFGIALQRLRGARGHHAAAAHAGAGAQIDDVIGAADRVLVVLDHHQRVAGRSPADRAHRAAPRCRADADRWSAHRARSTRPADSNRAAPPAGCAAPRRPRASAPRGRAPGTPGPTRSRKLSRLAISASASRAMAPSRAPSRSCSNTRAQLRDRQRGQLGDRALAKAQMQRDRIEARAVAGLAQCGCERRRRRRRPQSTALPRRSDRLRSSRPVRRCRSSAGTSPGWN